MKIKTSELTGKALDWAAWKIEHSAAKTDDELVAALSPFSPSSEWAQGGPIIEREGYEIHNGVDGDKVAHAEFQKYGIGKTILIAAMRCYVASRLGDVVDVPDELIGE